MKEKQIEEMANIVWRSPVCNHFVSYTDCYFMAEAIYNEGYRKQREGEWKLHNDGSGTCSECHKRQKNVWDYDRWQPYCGDCGALMKGGAE